MSLFFLYLFKNYDLFKGTDLIKGYNQIHDKKKPGFLLNL